MILDLDSIEENINKIKEKLQSPKVIVPPVPIIPHKADVDEDEREENSSHPQDIRFIKKCYKYLCKLGYVDSHSFPRSFKTRTNIILAWFYVEADIRPWMLYIIYCVIFRA